MIQKLFENLKNFLYLQDIEQWLQDIEKYLLLNRPRLWILKLPYVVCYTIMVNLLIIFLVFISPPTKYQIHNYLIPGTILLSFGEIIGISYWIHKQNLYKIEKQYGDLSNVYLEMLGYGFCIMLIIASPMIVFNMSVDVKAKITVIKNELTADLLILDSISYNYYNKHSKQNNVYADNDKSQDSLQSNCKKYFQGNDDKSKFVKEIICEKLVLVALVEPNGSDKYKVEDSEYQKLDDYLKDDIENIYNDLPLPKDKTEFQKTLSNKFGGNSNTAKIYDIINQYKKVDVFAEVFAEISKKLFKQPIPDENESLKQYGILDAVENARNIYNDIYHFNFLKYNLLWVLLFLSLGTFLLYSFKKTYKTDFVWALIYIFIFIAMLSYLNSLLSQRNSIIPLIIFMLTLIVFPLALGNIKNQKYWRFKTRIIIAFPVLLAICSFYIVDFLHYNKTIKDEGEFGFWVEIIIILFSSG